MSRRRIGFSSCRVVLALVLVSTLAGCSGGTPQPAGLGGAGAGASAGSGAGAAGTEVAGTGAAASGAAGSSSADDAGPSGTTLDASAANDATTEATDGGTQTTTRGTGPGDWQAGDYPADINAQTYLDIKGVPGQKGYTRQYKVHVPPSYDAQVPMPLVFCIHGLVQNPVMFCVAGSAMPDLSDDKGFILVMPLGYQNSWNGGTCCSGASSEQLDDVALFRAILEEVGGHLNVDLNRVYATGLSNGGFMSYRLACEAADLFAAVAPGAGAVGLNTIGGGTNPASNFTQCEPSEAVSVLAIHGTADGLVPYALEAPSIAQLAEGNGCGTSVGPAPLPMSAGDTTCKTHTGCPAGIEVTSCTVQNGGHCWFGSPDCGTGGGAIGAGVVGANSNTLINNDAVWDFFSRHHK